MVQDNNNYSKRLIGNCIQRMEWFIPVTLSDLDSNFLKPCLFFLVTCLIVNRLLVDGTE